MIASAGMASDPFVHDEVDQVVYVRRGGKDVATPVDQVVRHTRVFR